jgi:hypothetical protein
MTNIWGNPLHRIIAFFDERPNVDLHHLLSRYAGGKSVINCARDARKRNCKSDFAHESRGPLAGFSNGNKHQFIDKKQLQRRYR